MRSSSKSPRIAWNRVGGGPTPRRSGQPGRWPSSNLGIPREGGSRCEDAARAARRPGRCSRAGRAGLGCRSRSEGRSAPPPRAKREDLSPAWDIVVEPGSCYGTCGSVGHRTRQSARWIGGAGGARRDRSTPRSLLRALEAVTILLPAGVVFGAELLRHEVFPGLLPVGAGNAVTAGIALGASALILLPTYRRLESITARLQEAEVEKAVLAERERIARELHDSIAQALFFLGVRAASLEGALAGGDTGGARQAAGEIASTIRDVSQRVREAIFDLRTSPDPGQPFSAWVRSYVARFAEVHSLEASVEEQGRPVPLPLEAALHAMAVVREALHNVAKHAGARRVHVRIEWGPAGTVLTLADDGRGLPDPLPGPAQGRYGLLALREHARAVGGDVTVGPRPGGGTEVALRIPAPRGV